MITPGSLQWSFPLPSSVHVVEMAMTQLAHLCRHVLVMEAGDWITLACDPLGSLLAHGDFL